MSPFVTSLFRSIRGSLGRFLAIAAIVALGCGFYGGLRMTGPDMRIAADRFYDGTHLYDIRLLSTLGYSQSQVDAISAVEGVAAAMPSKSTDVMAQLNEEQYAMRISSFPAESANGSTCSDGCYVLSDDDSYINRLVLETGRWPKRAGECVISADRVSGVPIELGDTIEVLYGSQDLEGVLERQSFTLVGLAHSSSFVSAVTMGATSLGSGSIQQFAYVTESSFSPDCPYTEIYVEVDGARDLFSGSKEYEAHVGAVVTRLEGMKHSLAQARLADIKAQAQEKLDEESADYERERSNALAELNDAQEELDQAEADLNEGETKIAEGIESADAGYSELVEQEYFARSQLDAAYNQLLDTQAQLDSAQEQLDANRDQVQAWPTQREALVDQLEQAQAGLAQIQQSLPTDADLAQLDHLAQTQEQLQLLPENDPSRAAAEASLQALQEQAAQLEAARATQLELEEAIAQLEAGIEQGDALVEQYNQTNAQVQEGYAQLSAGWNEYYQQLAEAEREIDAGVAQLNEAYDTIRDSQEEAQQGRTDLESGREEYRQSRRNALAKLEDAAQLIANAQADIDTLEPPEIFVLERAKNYGVTSLEADSQRIDNIAAFFPFIFFLVAALVALTTMTRMVEEERTIIGTFKALGYSKGRIVGRYLVYAALASVIGAAVGLALLSQVLPYVISKAYAIIYNIPTPPLPLTFDWRLAGLAGGLGVGITLFATWAAATATLREQPASLMLPRAPAAGKRILLERLGPLWSRISFSWKVTLRNLFRYKKRMLMTVIGIAGCTALLLTGLGLHNAIWDIIDKQFGPVINYNIVVGLEDDVQETDITSIEDFMQREGEAVDTTRVHEANMQVASTGHDAMSTVVVVPSDAEAYTKLVTFKDRKSQQILTFDDASVVLTEKLARTLGVGIGESFTLYEQDEIGNTKGSGFPLVVTGIAENYIGNWAFIGKETFTTATGIDTLFTTLYSRTTEDEAKRTTFTEVLHDQKGVQTVTYNDETIDSYRKMLRSVNMIVVVLVVSAAALAFIVLYNLTNINITERRREIASLKVLGFTKQEVDAYIFREIVLLTILGALLGLVLGIFLESFVVETAEVDYVMFGREIHASSFLIAFVLTIVFSVFVMFAMRRKLAQVDMVESLKSVE